MYLKDINERYSLINCLLWSTVLSMALIVIDKKNLVTSRIGELEVILIVVIFLVLVGIVLLSKLNLNKLMEYPLVNIIDKYLFIALGITLIMQVIFFIGYENMFNYTWVNLLMIPIFLVLIYNRIDKIVLEEVLESSVVDLQDILEEKVTTNKPFLVRESEVDYDLLSRDILIDDLVNWIKNYQSNERFVVGIEGEWGSGKSTLIENVISNIKSDDTGNEFIVIDDFEPWLSENKVALLENLLSRILRNPQLKISDEDVSKIIENFTNLIFGRKFSIDFKFWEKDTEHSAKQIIADINKILAGNNQKIIFIIDNLDRISSENMLLLFNIIQNVLDFNNLIVIMSYDEHEVESVLQEKNISKGYLNKLVQKKVVLSPPNEDLLLNIYVQTFDSLVSIFKSDSFRNYRIDEIQRFLQVLVSNNQLDMREFKRLLNSAIIPILSSNSSKHLLDQIVIEYIKFSNFTLYNQILVNADYFISVDSGAISRFSFYKDGELDALFNTFYEDLEQKYIRGNYELKLLALIFPNINIYSNGSKRNYKNAVSSFRSSPEYIEIQKNKRICSGKFFELYFTLNYNYNSAIIDGIDVSIMGLKRKSITIAKIVEGIIKYPANAQHDFFENFEYYIDELESDELKQFAIELLNHYFEFKSYKVFFGLDIDERIAIVVSKIFEKLEFNDYREILNMYIENPKYLSAMDKVKYWLDKSHTSDNTEKLDYIKSKQENYIDELLSTDAINLFDSAIYSQRNVNPVLKYISERDDFDHRGYINQSLNSDTVFRIINDLIGVSIESSNAYNYHIVSNPDEHVDVKAVEDVLTNTEPKNEKEQFIKEVFQEYLTGEKDMFGIPKGVKTTESKDLRFV